MATMPLPRSVRGAPAELRRAIRRKQNSESARRCRARRRLERLANPQLAPQAPIPASVRISNLEKLVADLTAQLADAQAALISITKPMHPTTKQEPQGIQATQVPVEKPMDNTYTSPESLNSMSYSYISSCSSSTFDTKRLEEEFLSTIDVLAQL